MKISVLIDNSKSWFNDYIPGLVHLLKRYDKKPCLVRNRSKLKKRDVLFILSCDKILNKKELSFHRNNIVIHESDLPRGRGWSPLTWQVESGRNKIPITLFEATQECDAGKYYIKDYIQLDGTELIDQIRRKQFKKTAEMIKKYLSTYSMKAKRQRGKVTYYPKRKRQDNELNTHKNIINQFNKMRVVDNERYPLYFKFRRKKYILKIYNAGGD